MYTTKFNRFFYVEKYHSVLKRHRPGVKLTHCSKGCVVHGWIISQMIYITLITLVRSSAGN